MPFASHGLRQIFGAPRYRVAGAMIRSAPFFEIRWLARGRYVRNDPLDPCRTDPVRLQDLAAILHGGGASRMSCHGASSGG